MSTEAKNKEVIRRWNDIINDRKWGLVNEVLSEDYAHHMTGMKLEAIRKALPEMFSDSTLKVKIEDMIAEGDKVAIRSTFIEEGKEPRSALAYYRLSNGKIVDDWFAIND